MAVVDDALVWHESLLRCGGVRRFFNLELAERGLRPPPHNSETKGGTSKSILARYFGNQLQNVDSGEGHEQ